MKASRKLIPAFAMLLIAAVMMSTASYAWFVANSDVKVNSLQVSAQSASTYLIIDNLYDEDADDNDTDEFMTGDYHTTFVNWNGTVPELVPVAFEGGAWYTGIGNTVNDGTLNAESKQTVQENALNGVYALQVTYRMRIANGFPLAKDLKLTAATPAAAGEGSTNWNEVVGVVAKCGSNYNYLTWQGSGESAKMTLTNGTALSANVGYDAIEVTVFVFIDGNHPNVKTANASYLKNLIVNLTFSVGDAD